jgi:hypothetical protein
VLLDPEEAWRLANMLNWAAEDVDRYRAAHEPSPEEKRERMTRLARAVLPKLTDEQLIAGGLSENEVRDVRDNMPDESNQSQKGDWDQ